MRISKEMRILIKLLTYDEEIKKIKDKELYIICKKIYNQERLENFELIYIYDLPDEKKYILFDYLNQFDNMFI
jgi:hypothetical protein